jgi:hypothetical protein
MASSPVARWGTGRETSDGELKLGSPVIDWWRWFGRKGHRRAVAAAQKRCGRGSSDSGEGKGDAQQCAAPEASMWPRDGAGSQVFHREDVDCSKGVATRRRKIATWPYCPWGVCILIYVLRVAWIFAHPKKLHIYSYMVSRQLIYLVCFSFPCSLGLDFLHYFVENLTSECMEAFIVASISFLWLEWFSCLFRAIFVGFSCVSCSFDYEAFVFKFLCGGHG